MRKIIIVEDEAMLRESYKTIISTEPYDVDDAKDGAEALEKCKLKDYDLILLDLMMPKLDGLEFLKAFHSDTTKIIVMSNLSSGAMLDRAMELGADSSIVKSMLSPRELMTRVRYEVSSIL